MRKPDFEVSCGFCGKRFVVKRKHYLDGKRRNPEWIFYCSEACQLAKSKTGKVINCEGCGKEVYRPAHELEDARFCSRSCAATVTNVERAAEGITTKGKTKTLNCSKCGCEYVGSVHTSVSNNLCDDCRDQPKIFDRSCIDCGVDIQGSPGIKYCDACRAKNASLHMQKRMNEGTIFSKSIKCDYPFGDKKIRCDSKLEYVCLRYFQLEYDVAEMSRSQLVLPYQLDNKARDYYPDFEITLKDGTRYLVECKGVVSKKLSNKWHDYNRKSIEKKKVLEEWCQKNGYIPFWFDQRRHNKIYKDTKIDA